MKPLLNDRGEPFTEVLEYDGYLFPNMLGCQPDVNVAEHLASIDELGFEGDEICIVSYPRSGTHWTYEICNMLKTGSTDFIDTLITIFEYSPRDHLKIAQATNGIHSSHMYPSLMPKQAIEKRCKIVQVYRNPKDVAVSVFNFSKKVTNKYNTGDMGFPEYLRHFSSGNVPCGSWVKWIKEWNTFKKENPDYPLLQIAYEDMKKNLTESVRRIADFLRLNFTPQLIEEIAEKCEFSVMTAQKNSNIPQDMKLITDVKHEHVFYRKGEVGEWKNCFTVAESEAFDKNMETILPELGLNITYEL